VPLTDTQVLMRALQYAATFGYAVWLRPQDAWLGKGVAAQGAVATRLGLSGVPVLAETIALHTIFELVRATKARVHLCRLSSAAGVAAAAPRQGRRPAGDGRCEHQLAAPDRRGHRLLQRRHAPDAAACDRPRDRDALRAALADGTIDALVSDHNPVAEDMKNLPFGEAEPGATGLELLLAWPCAGVATAAMLGLPQALSRVTRDPVRCWGTHWGRWPPAPVGWSRAGWPTSASLIRWPNGR
jgi:dihydroorotase